MLFSNLFEDDKNQFLFENFDRFSRSTTLIVLQNLSLKLYVLSYICSDVAQFVFCRSHKNHIDAQ